MHRISLRGPWNLSLFADRMEASRKFHAPPGIIDRLDSSLPTDDNTPRPKLFFRWKISVEWPIHQLRLNDLPLFLAGSTEHFPESKSFFHFDSTAGVGTVDLAGILLRFNLVSMVWTRWPSEWRSMSGRYTPEPQHSFHFDSWLDIDE